MSSGFDYKDATFFNNYFNSLDNYQLSKEFVLNEKYCYCGEVVVLNNIHRIILEVQIPQNFPHHKMTFYTVSLFGYPHLIFNNYDRGKKRSWFCLNSPFGETAEDQLNLEIERLNDWFKKFLRPDLPAVIDNLEVIYALHKLNAYSWEEVEEIKNYHKDVKIKFASDYFNIADNFASFTSGIFHCIKSKDESIYIVKDSGLSNFSIPYLVVNSEPNFRSSKELLMNGHLKYLNDFNSIIDQYEFIDSDIDFLFPRVEKYYSVSRSKLFNTGNLNPKINRLWPTHLRYDRNNEELFRKALINLKIENEEHKKLVKKHINEIEEGAITFHNGTNLSVASLFGKSKYETDFYSEPDIEAECQPEILYFAIGVRNRNSINWHFYYTDDIIGVQYKQTIYDLGIGDVIVFERDKIAITELKHTFISEKQFWGRGSVCESLKNKKVGIIGIGAIGSHLAESLARSGVSNFYIWDKDKVEHGNICRSEYQLKHLGKYKQEALRDIITNCNPNACVFTSCNAKLNMYCDLYGDVNYNSQEEVLNQLKDCDLIFECTGSNELVHFLSYSIKDKPVISLCITNHSNDLLMISSADGNVFDIRKHFLSRIEQDTKNFYAEGSGCFSPTFLALNCDIVSLVNLAIREINKNFSRNIPINTTIFSHTESGVTADRLVHYYLDSLDINLIASTSVISKGENMADVMSGPIGYLFGGYSSDGKTIFLTHFSEVYKSEKELIDAFNTSNGIIDYIGDYYYSKGEEDTFNDSLYSLLASKAMDKSINTNNPLLAIRNIDGSITFFLYINGELLKFKKR